MTLIGGYSAVFCRKPRYCEAETECSAGPGSSLGLSTSKEIHQNVLLTQAGVFLTPGRSLPVASLAEGSRES